MQAIINRKFGVLIGLIIPFLFNATIVTAAPSYSNPEDISYLITPIIKQYQIPGMVVAVISKEETKAVGATGIRKRGYPEKITLDDIFHIGSDTKAMTAALLAILIQKNILQWDTKVTDVFPELIGKINPAYNQLTLQKLLTMQGGLPANINYDVIQQETNQNLIAARQKAMEVVLTQKPEFSPGTFHYSNLSYLIAGHMAEAKTGQTWEELMKTYIFDPLDMKSAGFGPPSKATSHAQPIGHDEKGQPIPPDSYGDNPAMIGPAGTVHLKILDWAKFARIFLNKQPSNFLTNDSLAKLETPMGSNPPYGMGWIVINMDWANGKVLTHAGSNELWYAKIWIAPQRNLAILIASNQGGENAKHAANAAGLAIIKHILKTNDIKAIDTSINK